MTENFLNLKKIKIYNLFWLVASIILLIGLIQDHTEDNTFDINVHDTYFVIGHFYVALFLSLGYYLTGLGYWIVQKAMKKKLIRLCKEKSRIQYTVFFRPNKKPKIV